MFKHSEQLLESRAGLQADSWGFMPQRHDPNSRNPLVTCHLLAPLSFYPLVKTMIRITAVGELLGQDIGIGLGATPQQSP